MDKNEGEENGQMVEKQEEGVCALVPGNCHRTRKIEKLMPAAGSLFTMTKESSNGAEFKTFP